MHTNIVINVLTRGLGLYYSERFNILYNDMFKFSHLLGITFNLNIPYVIFKYIISWAERKYIKKKILDKIKQYLVNPKAKQSMLSVYNKSGYIIYFT